MIKGDLFNVEGRLKTIDKDFILTFNEYTGEYYISRHGQHFQTVKWGELDDRIIQHAREVVYININGDITEEIEKANEKVDQDKEKTLANTIEAMAYDIRPYVARLKYE